MSSTYTKVCGGKHPFMTDRFVLSSIEDEVGAAIKKSGIPRENIFVVDKAS